MKILHFADAHIDMANYGRHDPETGLPLRVLDFLKSLDTIVDTAIDEKVDLVIFAGDTYKDRSPAPTYQREWGKRIYRLSESKIPTLLLVGNHDLSPATGRAHALQEFNTLQVPHVRVLDKPQFLSAEDLELPVQVIALPWVSKSGMMAYSEMSGEETEKVYDKLEDLLTEFVKDCFEKVDEKLPVIMTAHASVQGAKYGAERMVMLGNDLVLSGSLVRDKRLDYVALGHIHKPQNLNEDAHPPVIYPGSIERVDFGEAGDDKFFVIADITQGKTKVEWRKLDGIRPFVDVFAALESESGITDFLKSKLSKQEKLKDAIVRLVIEYPREWDTLIDEPALRKYTADAFEFHLVKRPQVEARIRLAADQTVSSLAPLELLEQYWQTLHTEDGEAEELQRMAKEIVNNEEDEPLP
ncbi:MAG: exonuclease SbcCD subunit D [Anaerolineae bacterium]|jgi:exonuclease SbcD|nr:exonuclease SbcCD subunit D [Anaerolineae bacterium]MBT4310980.1 exonuclease SbcCD subunit D [Anaerolineae bacterium]MBT4459730.1 exonuclease SbcCD subunit D [Anaerolineae bacterium]MBT4841840.1 exonuclease SbcCD subunit D [Anaerolineae bacterium]MBT6062440.1 exonuclease SbcCD subunit D [Anaerolineae bacterium]